ncbi:disulfide bond formation protein B [uncultured Sneathiella sp.]|jgi:disulfide bond formation protein DsbB|uniref:disulfide bond formation protein B n=1 Tax=uncultured Sneathiella sp. TaxID=879315 RepID=UPI0025951900|nr:disulfide bond formation protein B [uncultured Sneathiella sp.]
MRTETQKNCLFLAWLIALVSTFGALFIGEIMERTPCVLCWYQRIAMFPLALILGIAAFSSDTTVRRYVLPIAAIGAVVALWHSLLFAGIVPETVQPCTREGPSCTGDEQNLFGVLPLPFLSAAGFTAIILLLTIPFRKSST